MSTRLLHSSPLVDSETRVDLSRADLSRALSRQRSIGRLEAQVTDALRLPPTTKPPRFYAHPMHHRALLMIATSLRRYVADTKALPAMILISRARYEEYVHTTCASWYVYAAHPGARYTPVEIHIGAHLDNSTVALVAK